MTDACDPTALMRHVALVGDQRLVELLTRVLLDSVTGEPAVPQRVYSTLVARLNLGDTGNYGHP